ncbi:MAG TPA: class I SAM-dependent methyltransferase [Pyrinomonadaceae bacterium]|nr:class I SAM-dependent methyltransferase [Pyrinomonadaceae bacterium]
MSDETEIEKLRAELEETRRELERHRAWVPPGHVLSPIPDRDQVKHRESEIYAVPRESAGLDLNEGGQLELFDKLLAFYPDQPFKATRVDGLRYWFENPAYSYSDAILLYCMIRQLRPRRIVEVGAGYSSAAILDVNELFFEGSIRCTFIEPEPQLFLSLLKDDDADRITLLKTKLQEVPSEIFGELEENDILFVDSSHVSKVDSDVNHIFFRILPLLKSGVHIHFHDIFYPFEYPLDWVYEGRAWNEAYLLRAFLQYNSQFRIQLFNTFIDWFHKEKYFREMPLVQKNTGGSIWIKKL